MSSLAPQPLALLDALLRSPLAPASGPDVHAFWRAHVARTEHVDVPFDRAVLGGLHADRLGYTFAAGYQSALQAMVPALSRARLASLCATEAGGVQPRAIRSTLRRDGAAWRLSGQKTWVTLGLDAEVLLVVASAGTDEVGKNRLRVAAIDATRPGVTRLPMEPAPFVPEIGHAGLVLEDVVVADHELLPGDGYDLYLKPFRTIEDLYVEGAVLGHLVRMARNGDARPAGAEPAESPRELIEELLALIVQLRALCAAPPGAPAVHLALAGALRACKRFIEGEGGGAGALLARADDDTRARWSRDVPLLGIAERARTARRESAWRAVAAGERPGTGKGDR